MPKQGTRNKSTPHTPVADALRRLPRADKLLLAMLLAADSFTQEHALAITEEPATSTRLLSWQARRLVVHCAGSTDTLCLAPSLRTDLFACIEGPVPAFLAPAYRRSAEWLLTNNLPFRAVQSLAEASREEDFLRILEITGGNAAAFTDDELRGLAPLIEAIPLALRIQRPMGYFAFLFQYQKRVSLREGARFANAAEEYIAREAVLHPDDKRKLLGELALIQGFTRFSDSRSMISWFKKAHRLLRGPSQVCAPHEPWNYGSAHMGFLYLRERGSYASVCKYIETNVHHFTRVTNGCAAGFGNIMRAEQYLETARDTADLTRAEVAARLALREATRFGQTSSIIIVAFILARIALARSHPEEAMRIFERCRELDGVTPESVHQRTLDMIYCYLQACRGIPIPKPLWIPRDITPHACATHKAFTFTHILRGKHLLLLRDYDVAAEFCLGMRNLYTGTQLLGTIHTLIIEALATEQLEGEAKAIPILRSATKTAFPDNIIMPFAEYGEALAPMLAVLAARSARVKSSTPEYKQYLAYLAEAACRYARHGKVPANENMLAGLVKER